MLNTSLVTATSSADEARWLQGLSDARRSALNTAAAKAAETIKAADSKPLSAQEQAAAFAQRAQAAALATQANDERHALCQANNMIAELATRYNFPLVPAVYERCIENVRALRKQSDAAKVATARMLSNAIAAQQVATRLFQNNAAAAAAAMQQQQMAAAVQTAAANVAQTPDDKQRSEPPQNAQPAAASTRAASTSADTRKRSAERESSSPQEVEILETDEAPIIMPVNEEEASRAFEEELRAKRTRVGAAI